MEKSGEARWTELLLKILADIESEKLSSRFNAVEVPIGDGQLIVYSGRGEQITYGGYQNTDLDVLGNAGYLHVSYSGVEGRDVVVLQQAFDFKKQLNAPRWRTTALRALPVASPLKYGVAIIAGALLNQFANVVVWPWLSGLFGVAR